LDASLQNQDVRRQDQEKGCHDLFFNIDLRLDVGGQCGADDLALIGELLRFLAGELVGEIPENDNERMEDFVCPVPKVGTRRLLRSILDKSQRRLLGYTYMLGGKFTTCDKNRVRRSLTKEISVEAVCVFVDAATLDAKIAAKASREAKALFRQQATQALECDDLNKGQKSIKMANASLKAIKMAVKAGRKGAKRARLLCAKAKATPMEAELDEYLHNAEKASTIAMGAAEKAQRLLAQMQDETDVCNPAIVGEKQDDTGQINTNTTGNISIEEWQTKVSNKLFEKFFERINDNTPAELWPGCFGEGVSIDIGVSVAEPMTVEYSWIHTIEDCKKWL
jgi:hypothetical protein